MFWVLVVGCWLLVVGCWEKRYQVNIKKTKNQELMTKNAFAFVNQRETVSMKQKQLLSRPTLILVMGVAGSGKTNVARSILERVNAVYLDNNFIADAFFPHTRSDAEYLKIRRNLYDALYRI
ncbi:MAG: hypothetical protein KDI66_22530, partial [Xanthomonadales bacterium]|nr:hypothetical protein [Xanthomonadales bacterium]